MAAVKLVVEKNEGQSERHSIPLAAEETVVGRHRDCTLRIPSAEVSRRHCILHLKDDVLKIEDLGSLNGSYVNGERVIGTRELCPGDRLEIGPVIFSVEYEGVAVMAAVVESGTAEAAAMESATVDIKAQDTGLHQPPLAKEVVVAIEQVPEPARPEALTRLEK
jgi:pSer/pThr/pTyr-binding forkhead associated (FHA) protein